MKGEAHARFILPAAQVGDRSACRLAGCYLAARAASGKDLRAARRFLSQAAAAAKVPGAQGDLAELKGQLASREVHAMKKLKFGAGASSSVGVGADAGARVGNIGAADGGANAAGVGAGARNAHDADVDISDELEKLMGLVDAFKCLESDSPLIPGGLPVHMPILQEYMRSHRGSFTGWAMLYSCRHLLAALQATAQADLPAALMHLYYVFAFNHRCVGIPVSVDKQTGEAAFAPPFRPLMDYVDRQLDKGPLPAPYPHGMASAQAAECAELLKRAALGRPADAIAYIKRFQGGVPEDTDGLDESYSDLLRALRIQAFSKQAGACVEAPWDPWALPNEAERAMGLRVPVFQQLPFRHYPDLVDDVGTLTKWICLNRLLKVQEEQKAGNTAQPAVAPGAKSSHPEKEKRGPAGPRTAAAAAVEGSSAVRKTAAAEPCTPSGAVKRKWRPA
eukprot:jgi/Mesvir1/2786/Mv13721-RA.1